MSVFLAASGSNFKASHYVTLNKILAAAQNDLQLG
jgi:hypothetical protein